jgi:hypothetical protein
MLFSTFYLNFNKGLTMIPSLSRFGASLPAYSTNPAFTPTTENSKALGVSSRANTQRQGFSIVTFTGMMMETDLKPNQVSFTPSQVQDTLTDIFDRNLPRDIVPYLKERFESVFSNTDNPLTVLKEWLAGKRQDTPGITKQTLRAYIEDCKFYARMLEQTETPVQTSKTGQKPRSAKETKLDKWVEKMSNKEWSELPLTTTEQRRWASYKIWLKLELQHRNTTDQKQARGQLFTNLKRTLEALLEPSS